MGIEFGGRLHPTPGRELADRFLGRIKQASGLVVVREGPRSLGFRLPAGAGSDGPEQITLTLYPESLYLVFHAATGQQRDDLLRAVRAAMVTCGLDCPLEEL